MIWLIAFGLVITVAYIVFLVEGVRHEGWDDE
jgi:hypothetical protein